MRIFEKSLWYTLYFGALVTVPYILWKTITLSGGTLELYVGYTMIAAFVIFWTLIGWEMYEDINKK